MLIKTNYSGPYRIVEVDRNCTCPSYLDSISSRSPKPREPHIHITCTSPDGQGRYYLNGWLEDSLRSIDKSYCGCKTELDFDYITILDNDREIQMSLF